MVKIGFQASHEQFSPSELLHLVQLAEKAGFDFILSSDHVTPWSNAQHNSGFSLSWLGAAMQATSLSYSVICTPGYRYHPVVLAQAFATLSQMFPKRFFPCLGSGEALNEHVIGGLWPEKKIRNKILRESAEVMRRLWQGEKVSYKGNIVVEDAKLYSLPEQIPTIYGAALSHQTAEWLGEWADGLLTVVDTPEGLQERIQLFLKHQSIKKTLMLKADISYDVNYQQALDSAYEQWRYTMVDTKQVSELRLPEDFERETQKITKEDVKQKVKIISRSEESIPWIKQFIDIGFDIIVLHNVNQKQEQFIQDFGEHVLPFLKNSTIHKTERNYDQAASR